MTHSGEYKRHLVSPQWRRLRETVKVRAKGRCESCGVRKGIEVHHKTYERLGRERLEDLELLCADCHATADKHRAQETQTRVWNARFDGWASKVYGEDWEETGAGDQDDLEEEFARWLVNQE